MKKHNQSPLRILRPYMMKYKNLWVAGFFSVVMTSLFMMAAPWILKYAIDSMEKNVSASTLAQYAGAIVGVTLISAIFRYFMRQTMIVASRKIEYDFRNDLFSHLLTLDRSYYDSTPTGDIMARATNDLDSVRNMIGPGIMYFFSTAVTLTLALTLMISISLRLTLYCMIPLPVITILVFFLGREVNRRYARIQEQFSAITTKAQENFSGIRVVKAYVQEKSEIHDFSRLSADYVAKNMAMVRVWGLFFPAIVLFSATAVVIVLWFGGKAVVAGTISLGDFVAFTAYLLMLVWPMAALGWVVGLYQRGKASLTRIEQLFKARPTVREEKQAVSRDIEGRIEFRNLRFRRGSQEILKGINATIEAGMNVAIIGPTGGGKSTLLSLLNRSYTVERGMILIDNIDINDYSLKSLRSQVIHVMQEPFLFSETIQRNIAFGDDSLSLESVMRSALASGIAAEIEEFPEKYETVLGERGITLSGGQKQRTALARALGASPKILILDDPFSAVDTSTEREILQNLRQILKGKTTIMVSHRISTIKDADLILVLSDGKIVERGTHQELLPRGGHYAELYQRQLLEEELETL